MLFTEANETNIWHFDYFFYLVFDLAEAFFSFFS